jgi:phosphoglycerol transferase MdoB-like AlkP superfamily enzyme
MFLILLAITGISRRPIVSVGIMTGIVIAIGYAHISKFEVRGYPLLPEDFFVTTEFSGMLKFIDVSELLRTILAVALAIGLSILIHRLVFKRFFHQPELSKSRESWWIRWMIIPRILTITVASLVFVIATDFARNHQGMRFEPIPWLDSEFSSWNQATNYRNNGFIIGFLYNWQRFKLTRPPGYDEGTMSRIKAEYDGIARIENEERISLAEEEINVIVILNESFFDPSILKSIYPYTGGDITPNLRRIQRSHPNGWMFSTDYGGGTANIEFEVLTGLSNYWANSVPYTDIVPRAGAIPSLASYLRSRGYRATAIHPFNGSMYKRNIAFTNFGFETFITEKEMRHTEKEGAAQYINDRSAYQEVMDVLNSSNRNQFITLITMQNHLPYNREIYAEEEYLFRLTDMDHDPDRKSRIEVYFQLLHNSDKYLGEFISALDKSDKKVVVLFFGDHSPGIFNLVFDHEDTEVRRLAYMLPYFIYSNFEMENSVRNLPTTSPNCLPNTLFNVLNSKKPPMYYLLDRVCEEVPILTHTFFGYEAPFMSTVLSQYELINYDILGGQQFWLR